MVEIRRQNVLDAQKRRVFRRAHGIEDVTIDEGVSGVDIRGIVPWDDGLSPKERREGGRVDRVTGRMIMQGRVMGYVDENGKLIVPVLDKDGIPQMPQMKGTPQRMLSPEETLSVMKGQGEVGRLLPEAEGRPKVKKWLGIW